MELTIEHGNERVPGHYVLMLNIFFIFYFAVDKRKQHEKCSFENCADIFTELKGFTKARPYPLYFTPISSKKKV